MYKKTNSHIQCISFVLLLGFASSTLGVSNAIEQCDQLAASPDDQKRKAPGVAWAKINTKSAIRACKNANKQSPRLLRIQYQLARSLHKDRQLQKALTIYRELAHWTSQPSLDTS